MSKRRDLPYYKGDPVEISGRGWLLILAATILGFVSLVALPFAAPPLNFLNAILFTGLPLAALAMVAGRNWTALFGRYGLKEFGLSLGFAILTTAASFAVALGLSQFTQMSANPVFVTLSMGPLDVALFLARTFIQLVGEEVVTILPLLAVLWFCVSRLGLSKGVGLIIAVAVSTLWFAAMHLPTYNWNILQCVGIIGTARVVLTLSYLLTRNLWVSAGAHIINDWSQFLLGSLLGHGPIEAGGA